MYDHINNEVLDQTKASTGGPSQVNAMMVLHLPLYTYVWNTCLLCFRIDLVNEYAVRGIIRVFPGFKVYTEICNFDKQYKDR